MRSLPILLVLAAGAALVALAGAADAPAQEKPPAPATPQASVFDSKSPDTARVSASKLWIAAAEAKRAALHEFARMAARRVIEFDPDHREARALLGFSRRDGVWTEDAALAAKSPVSNFPEKPPAPEEAAKIERKWWRETWKTALSAAASSWSLLADECTKRQDEEGARKAHTRAIEFDPDLARSRAALGFYKFSAVWLTADQIRKVQAACVGESVDVESPADKALGVRLNKVRTPHFRLESRIAPDRLKEMIRWLETGYAVLLADAGRDPCESVFPSEVRMVICDSDAEWNAWVNTFVKGNREFVRGIEGTWGENWHYGMRAPADGLDETRRDHLLHRAIHAAGAFALGIRWPVWTDEGLAHLTTIRVQGMTRTWCVGPSRSDYARLEQPGGKSGWIDETEWKSVTRAAALARDDVSLRTMCLQPIQDLGFPGALKAWSFLDFLRTSEPAAWREVLPKLRTGKGSVDALEKHFGKGVEALDEDWRRFVVRTY